MLQNLKPGELAMLRPVALMDPGVLAYGSDDMYVLQTLFDGSGTDDINDPGVYQEWYGWITDYIDWDKKVWLPRPILVHSINHNSVSIIPHNVPWDGGSLRGTWSGNPSYFWLIGTAALEPMPHITQTRRLTVKQEREGKCSM